VGLTRGNGRAHLARAALEAIAYQSADAARATEVASGVRLEELKADGGASENGWLMQFQSDILGVPVIRPVVAETTALGAAYAAGLAVDFWSGTDELRERWEEDKRWEPAMDERERERQYGQWKKAVERTFDWVE
jgi:glycerol kinase